MKRTLTAVIALVLFSAAGGGTLHAQTRASFFVSGGLSLPLNTAFKDSYKTGWNGQAGVQFSSPAWPVAIRVDGMYGQNNRKNPAAGTTGKTKFLAGTANAVYEFKTTGNIKPYVLGGGGVSEVKYETTFSGTTTTISTTKALLDGGLGVKTAMSTLDLGLEGRLFNIFTSGNNTTFITLNLVVGFGGR